MRNHVPGVTHVFFSFDVSLRHLPVNEKLFIYKHAATKDPPTNIIRAPAVWRDSSSRRDTGGVHAKNPEATVCHTSPRKLQPW